MPYRGWRKPQQYWIVGDVAYLDVRTSKYPEGIGIIDATDVDLVLDGQGHWFAKESHGNLYIYRNLPDGSLERLHTKILCAPIVDHRNGDGLDNRRTNLREATHAENCRNKTRDRDSRSKYKGVTFVRFRSGNCRWLAQLTKNGKRVYQKTFTSEEAAARAYDVAALEHFGQFARINFPMESRDVVCV